MRYFSIADTATARVATTDIPIDDVVIRAGEGVIAAGAAANHDPQVFERPDELDFARGARHHVAFGYGIHQCLGQHLARLELEIVLATLLERIPTLRLAGPATELPFKDDAVLYGLYALPVTW